MANAMAGTWVLIPSKTHCFVPAQVIKEQEKGLLVRPKLPTGKNGPTETVPVDVPALDSSLVGERDINDLLDTSPWSEAAVLHHIRARHKRKQPYTGVACTNMLLSVNPFTDLPLHSEEALLAYSQHNPLFMQPHVYGVARAAYLAMEEEGLSTSIVLTGEACSGKTENSKHILRLLAQCEKNKGDEGNDVCTRLLEAVTVLESFGNCRTAQNSNASRFSKWVQLCYDESAALQRAVIQQYLLEGTRVESQAADERNFHVFYQLLASEKNTEQFAFLTGSTSDADASDYTRTCDAMKSLGFTEEERHTVFDILRGVLFLGNIEFRPGPKAVIRDGAKNAALVKAAQYLGIDAGRLEQTLCKKTLKSGRMRRVSVINIDLTTTEAKEARNTLAARSYEQLFRWLVSRLNRSLASGAEASAEVGEEERFIGVLDMSGFETTSTSTASSESTGGFQQLLINYAAEKLHQFFVQNILQKHKTMCDANSVPLGADIVFQDNAACVELFERRTAGLIKLMHDEERFPNASDKTFVEKLHQFHEDTPHYRKPRMSGTITFGVQHYAGEVLYDAKGFLDFNKQDFSDELHRVLNSSSTSIVKQMVAPSVGHTKQQRRTLGSQFASQVQELLAQISAQSNPIFINCIKPNTAKSSSKLDSALVLRQLRTHSVMDTVRLFQAGYPFHSPHFEFAERYRSLLPAGVEDDADDEMCKVILEDENKQRDGAATHFVIGQDLVLFGKRELEFLEAHLAQNKGEEGGIPEKYALPIPFLASPDKAQPEPEQEAEPQPTTEAASDEVKAEPAETQPEPVEEQPAVVEEPVAVEEAQEKKEEAAVVEEKKEEAAVVEEKKEEEPQEKPEDDTDGFVMVPSDVPQEECAAVVQEEQAKAELQPIMESVQEEAERLVELRQRLAAVPASVAASPEAVADARTVVQEASTEYPEELQAEIASTQQCLDECQHTEEQLRKGVDVQDRSIVVKHLKSAERLGLARRVVEEAHAFLESTKMSKQEMLAKSAAVATEVETETEAEAEDTADAKEEEAETDTEAEPQVDSAETEPEVVEEEKKEAVEEEKDADAAEEVAEVEQEEQESIDADAEVQPEEDETGDQETDETNNQEVEETDAKDDTAEEDDEQSTLAEDASETATEKEEEEEEEATTSPTPTTTDSSPITEQQREALNAILNAEHEYERHLNTTRMAFKLRLNTAIELGYPIVTEEEIDLVFSNIPDIHDLTQELCEALDLLFKKNDQDVLGGIGSLFSSFIPRLRLYEYYGNTYKNAVSEVKRLREDNQGFQQFLTLNEKSKEVELLRLLALPIEHLPTYVRLLGELRRHCTGEPKDALRTALKQLTLLVQSFRKREVSRKKTPSSTPTPEQSVSKDTNKDADAEVEQKEEKDTDAGAAVPEHKDTEEKEDVTEESKTEDELDSTTEQSQSHHESQSRSQPTTPAKKPRDSPAPTPTPGKKKSEEEEAGHTARKPELQETQAMSEVEKAMEMLRAQQRLPKLETWMNKRSPRMLVGWQKRWVLVTEYNLFYGKQEVHVNSAQAALDNDMNCIPLMVVKDICCKPRKDNVFEIHARDIKNATMRTFLFKVASKDDRDKWVAGLKEHKKHLTSLMTCTAIRLNTLDTNKH